MEQENRQRAEQGEPLKSVPVKFPPTSAYAEFAERLSNDWLEVQAQYVELPDLSDEQKAAAADAYQFRKQQLADYLSGENDAIAEWRHELWRLSEWEAKPGADDIPFQQEQIAAKRAETTAPGLKWVDQLRGIQRGYYADLRSIATEMAEPNENLAARVDKLLADDKERQLHWMNVAVTCLIIGVGACLMLGLFTRLAALGGAAFLLSVMATQPPWVEGADTTFFYYQLVELAALAVLFATAAGRIAGLDFFLHRLFAKSGESKGA